MLAAGATVGVVGCDGGKSAKSFSALERCLLGAPPKDDADLARRWRSLELSLRKAPEQTAATDWPKRCETYANDLYQSLGSSAENTLLRKELSTQLGCSDQPGSCKFPDEGPVLASPASLWKAVSVLGLERQDPGAIEPPAATGASPLPGTDWPTLAQKDWTLADRHETADGKVWLLLRAPSGRVAIRWCELVGTADAKTSFAKAKCREPHSAVPKLPLQSVNIVDHDLTPTLAGLTEEGRKAYELNTGTEVPVHGYPGSEVTEGIAVERGDNDEGYEAYVLAQGKASKPITIDVEAPLAGPMTVGRFVAWVEKGEQATEALVVMKSAGSDRLVEAARLDGAWGKGKLRACRIGAGWAVATWGGAKGERGAQPTQGSDATRVNVAFYDAEKKSWAGPVTGKIPFYRENEAPATCADGALTLAWAARAGDKPRAGRLTCAPSGCKSSESSWTSLGVQAWAGVAPLAGDQLLVAYRTTLGDVRARIGAASALDKASEHLLVDDQDHGGPLMGDPAVIVSGGATVLLFKTDSGLAGLRIGADGAAKPLPVE
jgi:hypothetical protein